MSETTQDLLVIQPQLPIGSLEAYIQRINDIPILTVEEEHRLATQFQEQGDLKAAQQLVLAHLKYVARVSRGYLGYGLPLGDLIQEGTVGLMKAVKRFNPQVGVRLVSFAVHWIKAEIHEYILRNWRIVKVATTKAQRKLFFNLRSAKKRLGWSTKEEVETIASDLGVSHAEVRRMEERLNARDVGFDLPAANSDSDNSQTRVPSEYLEDQAANPAVQLETENWDASADGQLKVAFQKLDPRSQDILEKRWLSENKETLQTLAEIYQVSPERIRQLESNALKKLKQLMVAIAA
ncbi:MAG TPA: RNA polymerase sigma factor RpoH [Gammaproteobacteria bacterium]|nr:RNA polymerase sigma factor RpoH [Gammaproteobacteria bacterium]